jgi:hypothetical protein
LGADDFNALQQEGFRHVWTRLERAMILATDEICLEGGISPATLIDLSQQITTEQIMELLFVVGAYIALAAILNTANAQIERGYLEQVKIAGFPLLQANAAGRQC